MRRFKDNQDKRIQKLTMKYGSVGKIRPTGAHSGEEMKLNNY